MARVVVDHVVKKGGDLVAVNDLSVGFQGRELSGVAVSLRLGEVHGRGMIAGLGEVSSSNIYIIGD